MDSDTGKHPRGCMCEFHVKHREAVKRANEKAKVGSGIPPTKPNVAITTNATPPASEGYKPPFPNMTPEQEAIWREVERIQNIETEEMKELISALKSFKWEDGTFYEMLENEATEAKTSLGAQMAVFLNQMIEQFQLLDAHSDYDEITSECEALERRVKQLEAREIPDEVEVTELDLMWLEALKHSVGMEGRSIYEVPCYVEGKRRVEGYKRKHLQERFNNFKSFFKYNRLDWEHFFIARYNDHLDPDHWNIRQVVEDEEG